MPITAITIENFKCIQEPIRIEFKPVTLLFGPNSSGKSTILQALHYAREILEHNNTDADNTSIGGKAVDLGGFKTFVYDHDLSRSIGIRFDLDLRDIDLSDYLFGAERELRHDSADWKNQVFGYVSRVHTAWVKVTVEWNKWLNKPVVDSYEVGLNGNIFAKIEADDNYHQFNLNIYRNKIFPYDQLIMDHFETFENFLTTESKRALEDIKDIEDVMDDFNKGEDIYIPQDDLSEDWSDDIDDQDSDYFTDDFEPPTYYEEYEPPEAEIFEKLPFRIGLQINQNSVLPEWDKNIVILDNFWKTDDYSTNQFYDHIISTLVKSPGIIVKDLLCRLRYIGPLREVPPRSYLPMLTRDESRWESGLAAWDALHFSGPELIDKTNSWLTGNEKLNTGYKIELKQFKEIDIRNPLALAISQGRFIEEDLPHKAFDKFPTRLRINLMLFTYLMEEYRNLVFAEYFNQ